MSIDKEEIKIDYIDYKELINLATLLFVAIDRTGKVALVNQKTCQVLGRKEEEIVGKNWFNEFIPEKTRRETKKVFNSIIRGEVKSSEYFQNPIVNKKGEERIINWHNSAIKNQRGEIVYSISFGEDVTEQEKTEIKLKKLVKLNQRIIDQSPLGIFIINKKGVVEYANKTIAEISGTTTDTFLGFNVFTSPSYQKIGLDKKIKSAIEAKEGFTTGVIRYISRHGQKETYRIFSGIPILDDRGNLEKFLLTVKDETELKKANEELERFNKLMVGRELKMVEMKKEIERLKDELNKIKGQI